MSAAPIVPNSSEGLQGSALVFALQALVDGKLDKKAFGEVYQEGFSASAQFFAKAYVESLTDVATNPFLVQGVSKEDIGKRFAEAVSPLNSTMVAFAFSQLKEKSTAAKVSFPELEQATARFQAITQAHAGQVPNPEFLGIPSALDFLGLPTTAPETSAPQGDVTVNLMLVKRALEKEGYSENSLAILKASAKDLEPLQPLLDLYTRQRKNGVGSTLGKGEETKLAEYPITLSQVERGVSSVIRGKQLDAVLATLALAAWRQGRSAPGSPDATHHRIRLAESIRSP